MRIQTYLITKQPKSFSKACIMWIFKYGSVTWIFCCKTANNFLKVVHMRVLRLVYHMKDANFEDLLIHSNSGLDLPPSSSSACAY